MRTIRVSLAGAFTQGQPLDRTMQERIDVPDDIMDEHDELYRVVKKGIPRMNLRTNDLLVVEPRPRGNASTTELVLVEYDRRAYVGRWWGKRGQRAVLDEDRQVIVEGVGVHVLGTITMIARLGLWK
jgi:hypothetical protein